MVSMILMSKQESELEAINIKSSIPREFLD